MGHLPLSVVGETGGQPVIAVDAGPGFDNGREPRPPGGPPLVRAVDESIGILMAQVAEEQVARWRRRSARIAREYMPMKGISRCARHSVVLIPWPALRDSRDKAGKPSLHPDSSCVLLM